MKWDVTWKFSLCMNGASKDEVGVMLWILCGGS